MGTCCKTEEHVNRFDLKIETYMVREQQASNAIQKILLLGADASGKSTLFKQLEYIFNPYGLHSSEFHEVSASIRQNCVDGMLKLLQKSQELYDSDPTRYTNCFIDLDSNENVMKHILIILECRWDTFKNLEDAKWEKLERLGVAIDYLWNNVEGIQATFNRRGTKFSFNDNMDYFFNKSKSIFCEHFHPTNEDVLKCRITTKGMVEETFEIQNVLLRIYDVAGQRNERKKWIHLFEGVTAVIYVAALSHFDAVCFEDEGQNAMHESIYLFQEICNLKWFKKTAMILFLNKNDLFRDKLMDFINIDYCFTRNSSGWNGEQYNGPLFKQSDTDCKDSNEQYFENCYKSQTDFIKEIYLDQRQDKTLLKTIYLHITNATNRNNIEKVFSDCRDMLIRKNMSDAAFLS